MVRRRRGEGASLDEVARDFLATTGVEAVEFTPAVGGDPARLSLKIGEALVRAAPGAAEHVPGQAPLPGMPPIDTRPPWNVELKAKATRTKRGPPLDPKALDANLGEEVDLYRETVTRVVSVRVQAVDEDEAMEAGQRRVQAMVGGIPELFADFNGKVTGYDWSVKAAK